MNKKLLTSVLGMTLSAVLLIAHGTSSARDLEKIRSASTLRVGVYKDFPPYADNGEGIDVDIAKALAERLNLKPDVFSYDADDNMDNDLRTIVWKGSALAIAPPPAEVMLHVPVDSVLMSRNPQVKIFAPYHRETMAAVRNTELLPKLDAITDVGNQTIGAEGDSIMSMALLSSNAGRLRNQVVHFRSPDEAQKALVEGRIAGYFGMRSQVEPILVATGKKFIMTVPPPLAGLPLAGWQLGLAVPANQSELQALLQKAMSDMSSDGTLDRIFKQHAVTRISPQ